VNESNLPFGASVATTNGLRRYPRVPSPKGNDSGLAERQQPTSFTFGQSFIVWLYIRTTEPPPTGTVIQLLLNVPAGEVRARAVVQRSEPKRGMGVKLVAMQQED